MSDYTIELNGYTMEFFEDQHLYLVNGMMLPSITQLLQKKYKHKYLYTAPAVLQRASERGTALHEQIETFCKTGVIETREVKHFAFLQKHYGFKVLNNEVPVVLFSEDEPVACGRLDLVLEMNGQIGLADIKRVSQLDRQYLFDQLNLYRIAYQQCYGQEISFLKGVHIKDDTRRFVNIPINEELVKKEFLHE